MSKLAIVLVRGPVRVRHDIKRALRQLNLLKSNHATIVEDSPIIRGQLAKIRSFTTWGVVNDETAKKIEPRAKDKGRWYSLQPPRKGFGRKGVKIPFSKSGALGDRGEKINDLLSRMV